MAVSAALQVDEVFPEQAGAVTLIKNRQWYLLTRVLKKTSHTAALPRWVSSHRQ